MGHGFALNVAPDMAAFSAFTACGLPEVAMASLAEMAAALGGPAPAEEAVRAAVADAFGASSRP
ncbi:hypothetical protein [Actinophytocola sp.]|uniref:hypothetical protein n=1 Tax=Actinophytocola sp. TaxID=1872138 RepID=UPI002ED44B4C